MFKKSSEHLQYSLIMVNNAQDWLEIGWKSFGNHCQPCFEVVKNLSTPSLIFASHPEIFGNSDSVTKNLTHFTEKSWQVYYYMYESLLLTYFYIPSVIHNQCPYNGYRELHSGRNIDSTFKNHCPTRLLFYFFGGAVWFN